MNNSEILSQAISKIRGIDNDKASSIAQSMAKNQVIRAICEQSVVLNTNRDFRKQKLRTSTTKNYA
jgi:hypothetical protein